MQASCAPYDTQEMSSSSRQVLVRQVRCEADDVISLTLEDPDGHDLPEWAPGAHIDLVLPSGRVRPYSLCGDPNTRREYKIAILRQPDGAGGSVETHDSNLVGRRLHIRGPRNRFRFSWAPEVLFIAGGIGITPLLPMVHEMDRSSASWRLVYGGKTRSSMAFLGELCQLYGSKIDVVPQDERGLLDLQSEIGDLLDGAYVYCCGPPSLIEATTQICSESPRVLLRTEHFSGPIYETGLPGGGSDVAPEFEVELRRTGVVFTVESHVTLLERILEVIPSFPYSCEEGYCGTCEAPVLEGIPDHRDTCLSDAERHSGRSVMVCVSRSKTPRLTLDL